MEFHVNFSSTVASWIDGVRRCLKRLQCRNALLRKELPWLVAEVVLLLILFNANAPELWFWLVVLLVVLGYRVERWWASRPES